MGDKETLFHIMWGDGDNTFVIAPDKQTAISRMPEGKDMVRSVVKLDELYKMIFKVGIREVVEWIPSLIEAIKKEMREDDWGVEHSVIYPDALDELVKRVVKAKLKEWGVEDG